MKLVAHDPHPELRQYIEVLFAQYDASPPPPVGVGAARARSRSGGEYDFDSPKMLRAGTKVCSTTGRLLIGPSTTAPFSVSILCAHEKKHSRDREGSIAVWAGDMC